VLIASQSDSKRSSLDLESSIIKVGFIRYGAMKSLNVILSCNTFTEFLLIPKQNKGVPRPSTSDSKDDEKDEKLCSTTPEEKDFVICPHCGKANPSDHSGDCLHCSQNSDLQMALAEAFSHVMEVIDSSLRRIDS
jgi:hypothetical protein